MSEIVGSVVAVVPPVEVDLGTAGALAGDIADAFAAGAGMVVVDFAAVLFCDSTGLRVLINAAKLARERATLFTIRNPTQQLLLIAHIVGASDVLGLPAPD